MLVGSKGVSEVTKAGAGRERRIKGERCYDNRRERVVVFVALCATSFLPLILINGCVTVQTAHPLSFSSFRISIDCNFL